MFDHVEINVSDMDVSRRFFEAALAPLGYETSVESPELVDMQAAAETISGSSAVTRSGLPCTSDLKRRIARLWTHSTTPPLPLAARTTGPPGSGPNMAITTTPRS
jgi:hypothetical protein